MFVAKEFVRHCPITNYTNPGLLIASLNMFKLLVSLALVAASAAIDCQSCMGMSFEGVTDEVKTMMEAALGDSE